MLSGKGRKTRVKEPQRAGSLVGSSPDMRDWRLPGWNRMRSLCLSKVVGPRLIAPLAHRSLLRIYF